MGGQQGPAGRRYARWLAAATAGLASLVLLGTGLAGTAQAAYPGTDGLIAFVRHGNIYTINPQSPAPATTVTRLTSDGHDAGPRWSPDGKRLAYLDRGNLWIMRANGSHKIRITDQAPAYTDARPSWSPNGRYLAFVRTRRGHGYGYLTRYDTVTRKFNVFSTPYMSEAPTRRQVDVTALPDPIAWGWALDSTGGTSGSFILVEGAGSFCTPARYCLLALGRPHQYMYRNAFPSAEDFTAKPTRLLDPDFFPVHPLFYLDVMTTQDSCPAGHCVPQGLDLTILASPVIPGAYEGVFSPTGDYIAYVRNVRGVPEIYAADDFPGVPSGSGARILTAGTQPDWQPLAPLPPT
jgi:hypothetical protein